MKKILCVILALMMLLSLAACGGSSSQPAATEAPAAPEATAAPPAATPEPTPEPAPETVTVTDMTGREVTVELPVTRVVALQPADCEILYALGAGDTVVGRGEYCDSPSEVLDVPSVQSGYNTNTEQIIALGPQVLFMSTMAQSEEQIQALENAGVHVVVSETTDIQGVYSAIEMIGKVMGKEDDASNGTVEPMNHTKEHAARLGIRFLDVLFHRLRQRLVAGLVALNNLSRAFIDDDKMVIFV